MSTLSLVRHGQASFGARNYDVLSPLGERQATLLGQHWRQCDMQFDAALSGMLQRQRVTGERALTALGQPPSMLRTERALDEYDHRGLFLAYLPLIAAEHSEFRLPPQELLRDLAAFQICFHLTIDAWMAGREPARPIAETWEAFNTRCVEGVIAAAALGQRVVAFTSGGVITAALRHALDLNLPATRRMNRRIHNASVHVFSLGRGGLSLVGYNDVSHLRLAGDSSLLSFR